MPSFNVETDEIPVFDFGGAYLFTAYTDKKQPFNQLKRYYNRDKYRLRILEEDLEKVQQMLDNYFFEQVAENTPEKYCVVADKETDTNTILGNSVMRKQCGQHYTNLMKNKSSVKQGVEQSAIRVEKPEVNAENLEWKTNGS